MQRGGVVVLCVVVLLFGAGLALKKEKAVTAGANGAAPSPRIHACPTA